MLNYLNNTSKATHEASKKSHNKSSQLQLSSSKFKKDYNDLHHKTTADKSNKRTNNKSNVKSKSHGKSNSQRLLTCHSQNKITKPKIFPNESKKT